MVMLVSAFVAFGAMALVRETVSDRGSGGTAVLLSMLAGGITAAAVYTALWDGPSTLVRMVRRR